MPLEHLTPFDEGPRMCRMFGRTSQVQLASRPSISTQRTCHGASAPYVQVTVVGPPIATAIAGVVRIVKLRRWPPQTRHGVPGGNSSKSAPQSEQLSLTLIIAPRLGTSAWPPYSARSTNRIVVLRPDSYRRVA